MPKIAILFCALVLLAASFPQANAATIHQLPSSIQLRRTTINPSSPQLQSVSGASSLQIVQLATAPGPAAEAELRAAGLEPLGYIPDHAYLVRVGTNQSTRMPASARWSSALATDWKLDSALELAFSRNQTLEVTLETTPDRDGSALAAAVISAGGTVERRHVGTHGAVVIASISTAALRTLLARDDLLWAEQATPIQLLNDKGRQILRLDEARAAVPGLTGRGQIVAVADTGLDIEANVEAGLNPDFLPSRVIAANNVCDSSYGWTDDDGHGTHVAGTVLGSGAASPNNQFAGIAPEASLVLQSLALPKSGNQSGVFCGFDMTALLQAAHASGAHILNASWGQETQGQYNALAREVDSAIASGQMQDLLMVVAAGNSGRDSDLNGVIDSKSLNSPGTAKNVLTVGATESNRPEQRTTWGTFFTFTTVEPIRSDPFSNNPDGMAAFSSRGPTSDGRIKPELVAPGVAIISAASHAAQYNEYYAGAGLNYAYDSGTSMSVPMVSGAAALVRQWLAEQRGITQPSAALVKALLLNGATNITPGQYGEGTAREIPAAWPNNVEGWGRANVASSIGVGDTPLVVDENSNDGIHSGEQKTYPLQLTARQTVRVTLAWSDPAPLAISAKALVNDLDLELLDPNGAVIARGNQNADLPATCRNNGRDTCNNVEALAFTASASGTYTIRVVGSVIPFGGQPFGLVAGSSAPGAAPDGMDATSPANTPLISATWKPLPGATSYEVLVERMSAPSYTLPTITTATTSIVVLGDLGNYAVRVRGCNINGCGPYGSSVSVTVSTPPHKSFLPQANR